MSSTRQRHLFRERTTANDLAALAIDDQAPGHALLKGDCDDELALPADVTRQRETFPLKPASHAHPLGVRQPGANKFTQLRHGGLGRAGVMMRSSGKGGERGGDEERTAAHGGSIGGSA
jgi:hypothetical protein